MSARECLFCKIIAGTIPAKKVAETERHLAFHDIQPQARTHVLVIPKAHAPSLDELAAEEAGELMIAVAQVARDLGLSVGGYRTVLNTGKHAGQTVFHVHAHILGGEPLGHFGR